MNTYKELGSADSFNASLANDYGTSFLTVDNKLVKNIEDNLDNFPNIEMYIMLHQHNKAIKTSDFSEVFLCIY